MSPGSNFPWKRWPSTGLAVQEKHGKREGADEIHQDRNSQFSYPYNEVAESHITVQHRAVFDNLDRMKEAFLAIEQGRAEIIDTSGRASGNWGQPWLSRYIGWKLAARRRAKA